MAASCFAANEFNRFEFSAFSLLPGDYSNIHFLNAENAWTVIEFNKKSRSNLHLAQAPSDTNTLIFYDQTLTSEGTFDREAIASVRIDPNWRKVLLIFSKPPADKEERYAITAIDDSTNALPPGNISIVNLTGVPIIGDIDGNRIRLEQATASRRQKVMKSETVGITIVAESSVRAHLIFKNTIPVSRQSRSLLFLRPPKRIGSVKIKGQLLLDYGTEE